MGDEKQHLDILSLIDPDKLSAKDRFTVELAKRFVDGDRSKFIIQSNSRFNLHVGISCRGSYFGIHHAQGRVLADYLHCLNLSGRLKDISYLFNDEKFRELVEPEQMGGFVSVAAVDKINVYNMNPFDLARGSTGVLSDVSPPAILYCGSWKPEEAIKRVDELRDYSRKVRQVVRLVVQEKHKH